MTDTRPPAFLHDALSAPVKVERYEVRCECGWFTVQQTPFDASKRHKQHRVAPPSGRPRVERH